MPVAFQQPSGGQQTLDPDRTAGVDASGRDPDFGAESVSETIGEAGGCVPEDRGGVDLVEEAGRDLRILGCDGFGVRRTVLVDVIDGGVEPVDHPHGQGQIAVLGVPVFGSGGDDLGSAGRDRRVAT